MNKWNELDNSNINIEVEFGYDYHLIVDLMKFDDINEEYDDIKILNVSNKYNQPFPKSLQSRIDLYTKQNSPYDLIGLLYDFTKINLYDSNLVTNPQALFVEYLNLTTKDFEEAYDIFTNKAGDYMINIDKHLTDKREILEKILKMLSRTSHLEDIIILTNEFIDKQKITNAVIKSLKDIGEYENVTEEDIEELVYRELEQIRYENYENPEDLIGYINVEKAYNYILKHYTILVDDNGTSIIDNYYV